MSAGLSGRYPLSFPRGTFAPIERPATTTGPSTAPVGVLEEVEHLDTAWDIACEYQGGEQQPPCGDHADWWLVCLECGASVAECNRHRVEQHQLWIRSPTDRVLCRRCFAEVSSRRWRDLFRVTPIEGRP